MLQNAIVQIAWKDCLSRCHIACCIDHSHVCRAMRMKRPAVALPAATLQALVAPAMAPQAFLTTTRYCPHYLCGSSCLADDCHCGCQRLLLSGHGAISMTLEICLLHAPTVATMSFDALLLRGVWYDTVLWGRLWPAAAATTAAAGFKQWGQFWR